MTMSQHASIATTAGPLASGTSAAERHSTLPGPLSGTVTLTLQTAFAQRLVLGRPAELERVGVRGLFVFADLMNIIWHGAAEANTGTPGIVAGKGAERVLRAPADGVVQWRKEIGDRVGKGEVLGEVDGQPVYAPFDGVARGLIAPGTAVPAKLKIGDVDPRGDVATCFTISEKALAIGGGVVEAVLTWLSAQKV